MVAVKITVTTSTHRKADDLLDEIAALLDTNAEEFVKSFVQKGGQ